MKRIILILCLCSPFAAGAGVAWMLASIDAPPAPQSSIYDIDDWHDD